ncbi:MAG: hypothetical protein ABSD44_06620 [Terracidiphilus sp.]
MSAVRIAPMVRYRETDLGLTDVVEIERSSRTGDETYSPSGARAATGFEDEEEDFDDLDVDAEPSLKTAAIRKVDFVA